MKLLPAILLSVASVLSVRSPGQVVIPAPGVRVILAGPGITVNTNGFTRTISAPGAAGDITGGAVTGGMLTVAENAGILTFGLATNAVLAATASTYVPFSGGTMTGAARWENIDYTLDIGAGNGTDFDSGYLGLYAIAGNGNLGGIRYYPTGPGSFQIKQLNQDWATIVSTANLATYGGTYFAPLSTVTNLNASYVTAGTLDRARLPTSQTTPAISWASSDCTFHTTAGVWWYTYENSGIDFGAYGLRAAAADDQTGTLRTKWVRRPAEASAYHETSAIVLTFAVSTTAGVTEVRGLRLMGRNAKTDTPTTVYTDTTTRDGHASSAGALVTAAIARSSLSTTNLFTDYQAEVDVSVEDAEVLALESIEVRFE